MESRALKTLFWIAVCGGFFSGTAPASAATSREVTFRNGDVELAGTLVLPEGSGPRPAVVFLHGSGPASRDGARPYADAFARMGVASLIFDKRGSGQSGGSWLTASLEDLANDALAAVALARAQPELDPARIGFWGVSQAGWVATLAASRSRDVAFLILISGGGASPRESELFSYEQSFAQAALAADDLADARAAVQAYFRYLESGVGRAELAARLEAAHERRWYELAPLDRILPSETNRSNWAWVANWDPAPAMAEIRCPVLLMFGDRDTDHPTTVAVARWREALKKAGNRDVSIVVFPGAGHGIRMHEGFSGSGRPPFADGYAELMLGWLWRHVVSPDS